jgi:oxygen-dependent protoporphyrinogen oxidase
MRRVAIVGGGVAGLTAAYELACLAGEGAAVEAVLFEGSQRLGGLIETIREGGFTMECGPDGWMSAKPWARELAVELGLADELIGSNDATRKTHIFLTTPDNPSGRLVAMPDGMNMMVPSDLAALEGSPLFSNAAIAAYRAEPARAEELRAAAPTLDESVADFTLRHFGPEVLERVAAPLLSGVFGGDVRRLSVRAVMPAFVEMERKHGSLVAASQTEKLKARESQPIFTTLRSGLGTLVERLAAAIPADWIRKGTRVSAVRFTSEGQCMVHTAAAGKHYGAETFDAVLLATPLDATRSLLAPLDEGAAKLLPMESSSAVLVAFAYADAAQFPVPLGFGFLVPPRQPDADRATDPSASMLLACTFVDQKFAHRVPQGGRLVRAFFGGAAATRIAKCNNDEIAAIARMELARVLQANDPLAAHSPAPPPVVTMVRRWPNSLPQYAVGHPERVAEIESRLRALKGISILGNALNGVGIPDLIRDARQTARVAATSE